MSSPAGTSPLRLGHPVPSSDHDAARVHERGIPIWNGSHALPSLQRFVDHGQPPETIEKKQSQGVASNLKTICCSRMRNLLFQHRMLSQDSVIRKGVEPDFINDFAGLLSTCGYSRMDDLAKSHFPRKIVPGRSLKHPSATCPPSHSSLTRLLPAAFLLALRMDLLGRP
ncbi:hypothetical protein K491DRAFT_233666 [Lophiostoma macrostomum CBS 122681]|uniref:Uncharacterized protein n=1 Tax=Lophiostoma macrostomum CBS 122681 TaxID=1314788 RepID=A0A6A6SRC0_9PLEO|nr:hypothetical protein K491DRAFT_233666 [Lophiostoma macrostomum CBS 122681]